VGIPTSPHIYIRQAGIIGAAQVAEHQTEERIMKTIAYQYLNNEKVYRKPVQNGYQNYNWISPKAVVKQAKRSTRFKGVFPFPFLSSRARIGGSLYNARFTAARNTGNILASMICIAVIMFSLIAIITSQPQGEVPQESPDFLDPDQQDASESRMGSAQDIEEAPDPVTDDDSLN